MEFSLYTFTAEEGEVGPPKAVRHIHTPNGWTFLLLPSVSPEILMAVRDDLNAEISRLQSENVMLKAMVPQGPVQ